VVQNASDGPSN